MPKRNMAENKIDKNMSDRKEQHKQETLENRAQETESNNSLIYETRIDKDYQEGYMPSAHQKVLKGFIQAVGGVGQEGEINLQRQVLDVMKLSRSSVLRVIPYLVKYGYIHYEARPLKHCSFVKIIKGV